MRAELKPLLDRERIFKRIEELGADLVNDYKDKELLCIGILKGSVPFFTHLVESMDLSLETDFICVSSYGGATKSSGEIKWVLDLARPVHDKHILIVEDIVDTGRTLNALLESLRIRKPKSIKVASLLSKPSRREIEVPIDYLGFEIEDHFVVGFGLDYAEKYRNLPYIAILPENLV